MVLIGDVDEAGKRLVKVTHDCWRAAIDYCKPGKPYNGIGKIIEEYIQPHGYSSVREFCGHGIGKVFHTNPNILHYKNNEPGKMEVRAASAAARGSMRFGYDGRLCSRCFMFARVFWQVGHVFTIEPMICEGVFQHVMWNDQWTATTRDGKRSAQFEHTLLVTPDGVEAFTGRIPTSNPYFWEEGGAPLIDAARGLSLVVPDADVNWGSAPPTPAPPTSAAPPPAASAAATSAAASASALKKQEKAKAAAAKKKKGKK